MQNLNVYEAGSVSWYEDDGHPFALLRAEHRFRWPWVQNVLRDLPLPRVVDAGCGAGILTQELERLGLDVIGVDQSEQSLDVARHLCPKATFIRSDLSQLSLESESVGAVCAMDVLEHLHDIPGFVSEVARVLSPEGRFVFYSFNQTLLSRLLVVRAMDVLFPKDKGIHVPELLVNLTSFKTLLFEAGLELIELRGVRPVFFQKAMLKLLLKRRVAPEFAFRFSRSLSVGFMGWARRVGRLR